MVTPYYKSRELIVYSLFPVAVTAAKPYLPKRRRAAGCWAPWRGRCAALRPPPPAPPPPPLTTTARTALRTTLLIYSTLKLNLAL